MRGFIIGAVLSICAFIFAAVVAGIGHAGTWKASCYGSEAGSLTASGESFVASDHTAAHRSLPFGTRLLVRRGSRSVAVTVNDRGPYIGGRDLDLSMGACQAIDLTNEGVGPVEVEQVESSASGSETLPATGGPAK